MPNSDDEFADPDAFDDELITQKYDDRRAPEKRKPGRPPKLYTLKECPDRSPDELLTEMVRTLNRQFEIVRQTSEKRTLQPQEVLALGRLSRIIVPVVKEVRAFKPVGEDLSHLTDKELAEHYRGLANKLDPPGG